MIHIDVLNCSIVNWFLYFQRIILEAPCQMDFTTFPMDEAVCELTIESYSFNIGTVFHQNSPFLNSNLANIDHVLQVRLFWKRTDNPVVIKPENVRVPEYKLYSFNRSNERFDYPAGIWDQLSVKLYFRFDLSFDVQLVINHN